MHLGGRVFFGGGGCIGELGRLGRISLPGSKLADDGVLEGDKVIDKSVQSLVKGFLASPEGKFWWFGQQREQQQKWTSSDATSEVGE